MELELSHVRGGATGAQRTGGGARAVTQERGGATGAQRTGVELELLR